MSYPYIYPQFYYQTPYLYPYHQQPQISPFVPNIQLPSTPASPAASHVHFADEEGYPETRPRPPSWHAGSAPAAMPMPSPPIIYAPLPPMMPPVGPPPGYIPHRRRSEGCAPAMNPAWVSVPWLMYPTPPTYQTPPPQFHPFLSGEQGKPALYFDLSLHSFEPLKFTSGRVGARLTLEELRQQATHPGVTRMVITCDALPADWKVVLEPPENRSHFLSLPRATTTEPITVGDILVAIHKMLHTRISHRDWVKLSRTDEVEIARAYTRRCRTFPSVEQYDANQGVRRVDYLKEKFIFKGLIRRRGEQGFEHVKLLTGPKL